MTRCPTRLRCAPLALAAALLFGASALQGAALEPGPSNTANKCDEMVAGLQDLITQSYDNLPALDALLEEWGSSLREALPLYNRQALGRLTESDIEKRADELQVLRDCLPKIKEAFERLKRRIGQLEDLAGTSVDNSRAHSHRQRLLDRAETLHQEISVLLDEMI